MPSSQPIAESPRIAPAIDLLPLQAAGPKPRPEGLSRYRAMSGSDRGLPTALPVAERRCGLRRYERDGHVEAPPRGARVNLPDKEFRYLRHTCYSVGCDRVVLDGAVS